MTDYATEPVRFKLTGLDYDDTTLGEDDASAVTITIQDDEGTEVLAAAAMPWDSGESSWLYTWDTTSDGAGSYRAMIKFTGAADSLISLEYVTVRLYPKPF